MITTNSNASSLTTGGISNLQSFPTINGSKLPTNTTSTAVTTLDQLSPNKQQQQKDLFSQKDDDSNFFGHKLSSPAAAARSSLPGTGLPLSNNQKSNNANFTSGIMDLITIWQESERKSKKI